MSEPTMQLLIPEPERFYCQADEDHFFDWLNGVEGVEAVKGRPEGLWLTLKMPASRSTVYDLIGLLTRYGLDRTSLRPLCEGQADPWFSDTKNYWYEAVFK